MAYDETLAERVRKILAPGPALTERKMFGGLAFMLDGNMCCGIVGDKLMLRLGADLAAECARAATRGADGLHRQTDDRHGLRSPEAYAAKSSGWIERAVASLERFRGSAARDALLRRGAAAVVGDVCHATLVAGMRDGGGGGEYGRRPRRLFAPAGERELHLALT